MAQDNDEIEVAVEAKANPAAKEEEPIVQEEGEEAQVSDAQAALDLLKKQLESERSARAAAEMQGRQLAEMAKKAEKDKREAQLEFLQSSRSVHESKSKQLESAYAQALAEGDHVRAAELNSEMHKTSTTFEIVSQGIEAMKNAPLPEIVPVAPPADPVERLASSMTPRSAQWIREHPEYARDQRLYNKMIAAHHLAIADGLKTDTNEYFAEIEAVLKIRREPERAAPQESALSQAAAPAAKRSPPAAPVTRGSGGDSRIVTLSAQEVEMASLMGLTKEQYAKHKQQLKKEGKMN